MDGMIDKLKRKLAISEEPEVISPADREQRLRQMLGYAQPKDIDPGFAADVPADSGDEKFGIKEPLVLEPQRPIPGKPGLVDQVARYKKKKTPIEQAQEDAVSQQREAALAIDSRKSGSSNPSPLEGMKVQSQQEIQQEMDDEFYRQAELLRKQREAMKAPASGLSNLEQQAKKRK